MKKDKRNPTDSELEILSALWRYGPGTVRQIQEKLTGEPVRGYTTVLKLLQIMAEKGLVKRDETQRAHVYEACIGLEQTQQKLLNHLLDKAFDGSASKLVMHALSTKPASKKELAEIRRLFDVDRRKR